MIVTCQNCETSFQLDESRVPPQGIRVRCSRCKEAFFLAHPSASASDAIHGAADEATRSGGVPAPGTTQDLGKPAGAPQGRPGAREDEDDWEFNLDPPSRARERDDDTGAGAAGGDLGSAADGSSGLSLAGEEDDEDVAAEGDSAFGSVDDYSALMEEDEGNTATAAATEMDPAPEATPIRGDAAGRYAATGKSDDLGDPESWDFFGESSPASSPPAGAAASGAVLGRIALTPSSAADLGDSAGLGDLDAWDDDAYADLEESATAGPILRAVGYAGHAIGWTVTLSLLAVVCISGFWRTAESLVRSPQDIGVGRLEARDVTAHWVDTARGETLLAVRGELVNRSGGALVLDGVLQVALLDAQGQPIDVPAQPAGLEIAARDIRELDPTALRVAIDRAAWRLAHEPLAAAQSTAFLAIFRDVPSQAARFAVGVGDGTGASPSGGLLEPEAAAAGEPIALDAVEAVDLTGAGADAMPGAAVPDLADEPTHPDDARRAAGEVAPDGGRPEESGGLPDELTWGD